MVWRRGRTPAAAVLLAAVLLAVGFAATSAVGAAMAVTAATDLTVRLVVVVESSTMTSEPRSFLRARSVAPFARGSVNVREARSSFPVLPTNTIRLCFEEPLTTSLTDTALPLSLSSAGTSGRGPDPGIPMVGRNTTVVGAITRNPSQIRRPNAQDLGVMPPPRVVQLTLRWYASAGEPIYVASGMACGPGVCRMLRTR